MSARWCLTAWKLPTGRPNCSRTLAYSTAISKIARAPPAASAPAKIRSISSAADPAFGTTRTWDTGTPSANETFARPRDESTEGAGSIDIPGAARSMTRRSSSARRNSVVAQVPAITSPASPATLPRAFRRKRPDRPSPGTREPSTRPGKSCRQWAEPTEASAADVTTEVKNGPGDITRPSSLATTAVSASSNPDPPNSSATCKPSQPCAAISLQMAGSFMAGSRRASRAS